MKFKPQNIKGVIPAMVTIFDEDENIDEQATRDFVEFLISKDIDGLYLTGSTGEGFLMDGNERKKYVEIVIDQVKNRVPVIVHVGDIGTKKSIENAIHAYEAGADAISSVPPFYWKFNQDQIYSYYNDIADATPIPMIIYNIPLAGAMGIDTVVKLGQIKNVCGIKYTLTSHFEIPLIKEKLGEDFLVYSGCDEMAISGLSMGADGIIGSFYNLMPEIFVDLFKAVKENNFEVAKLKQLHITSVINVCVKYNYLSLIKVALSWMGVNAGYCRKPFDNISGQQEEEIKAELRKLRDDLGITGIDFLEVL